MSKELAQLIFPHVTLTIEDLNKKYPARKEKMVTRFAPSPTGFLHIGGVYTALINQRMAHQNDGVFFLRIEDTDKKREVAGSKEIILNVFDKLGMKINEGPTLTDKDSGLYGPYTQSLRKDIYHVLAKSLMEKGLAYPCFCTEEELEQIREEQALDKAMPGFYGKYAKYRDITANEAKKLIEAGQEYVVRFRVPNDISSRITFTDLIKGEISMESNNNDIVLLKTDGIPTYHFAHASDDHYMGVTNVIRSDEWLASVPVHIQLFEALGFEVPKYSHVAPIMKLDGDSRRKLSKRKDPESSAEFYLETGYPIKSLFVYLYTLISSNFEEWYLNNLDKDLTEFEFKFENMGVSGPLYDLEKLNSISSEIIYSTPLEQNVSNLLAWAKQYNKEIYTRLNSNLELVYSFFKTQGPDSNEHRKDLYNYSMFLDVFGIFYNDIFVSSDNSFKTELYENIKEEDIPSLAKSFINLFTEIKNGSEKNLKNLCDELGYTNKKKYEKNPELYKGINTQFYHALRIMLTHKSSGISMDDIILILGYDEVIRRISIFA